MKARLGLLAETFGFACSYSGEYPGWSYKEDSRIREVFKESYKELFGEEMKKFAGTVPGDDEEYLSCIYPTQKGLSNAWNGDAIVAHFAFFTQRESLDKAGILERYGQINAAQWHESAEAAAIYDAVQKIMTDVQSSESELMMRPSPYRRVVVPKSFRSSVKKFIPKTLLDFRAFMSERKDRSGFILDK